jgi:hypothetical protein
VHAGGLQGLRQGHVRQDGGQPRHQPQCHGARRLCSAHPPHPQRGIQMMGSWWRCP